MLNRTHGMFIMSDVGTVLYKNKKNCLFVAYLLLFFLLLQPISYAAKPTSLFFKDAYTLQDIEETASGEDLREFKVQIIDRNRQGAPDDVVERIEWAVDNEEIIIETAQGKDGYSHIKMIPINAGDYTLSARFDGQYKNKTIVFGHQYHLSEEGVKIEVDGAKANGVATNQLKVKVLDLDNQQVANAEVKWRLVENNINAVLSQESSITNDDGEATIEVTAEQPGYVRVAVDITGLTYSENTNSKEIEFTELSEADKTGFEHLRVSRTLAKGDGVDRIRALVELADDLSIEDVEIQWSIKRLDGSDFNESDQDNPQTAFFTQSYAGDAVIEATVKTRNGEVEKVERKTQQVRFTNIYNITRLDVGNNQKNGNRVKEIEANGVDAITVFAQLNLPADNATVAWRLEDNTASAFLSDTTTVFDETGLASVEVMATKAGSTTIVAQFVDKFGEPYGDRVRFPLHQAFKKTYNTGIHSIKKDKVAAKAGGSQGIEVSLFVDIGDGVTPSVNRPVVWMLKDNTIDARLEPERVLTDDKGYARTTVFA